MGKKGVKLSVSSNFRSKYSGSGLASEIAATPEDTLWLPSRSLALNYTMGGGIPFGKIAEFYGGESSGKTVVAQDFGYVTQALGGVILWDDAEQAFTIEWAKANGLNPELIELYPETSVEKVSDWLMESVLYWRNKLVNNEPILFICDSLAALDCEANIDSSQSDAKAEMGNRAKAIYKMIRIRNQFLTKAGVTSIYINQLRSKVGASQFQDPDTTPGGNAMKFFASIRLGFYPGKQVKAKVSGKEVRVGNCTSIRVKKNKVAPPRETLSTEMYFNVGYKKPLGIDRYMGLSNILVADGVLKRKGNLYFYGENKIALGESACDLLLSRDNSLRKELVNLSSINSLSKIRARLSELDTNKFKVSKKDVDYE